MNTLVISGKLETRTALHIGSGQSSSEADALLRRNAAGEVFIPGSAVAGALRALATRLAPRLDAKGNVCKALKASPKRRTACGCMVCHLFGDVDPQKGNTEESGGRAARLWVYDAQLCQETSEAETPPRPHTWIRDGVGIDRRTGAAARLESVKFDLEVLPAGATFELRLELEDASEEDNQLLAAALAEWRASRASLGGRVARGLGAFELTDLKCERRNLNDANALMAFLRDEPGAGLSEKGNWFGDQLSKALQRVQSIGDNPHLAQNTHVAWGWIEVELALQATGPFLVNDPTVAGLSGFDHAPLVEWRLVKDEQAEPTLQMKRIPVLPGASLRGVLRSHAERIARTLATEQAEDKDYFLNHCPACSPIARPRGEEDVPLECCDSLLDIPADQEVDEADLCLACRLFGSPRLGSRLIVEDAPLKKDSELVYKVQDFLAIDRFTGGGREGAKFDAAALWKPAFTARLRLENPRDWELGWLALVLRDLAEGWLTVGFGRAKGFGQVTVPGWTVSIGFIRPEDFPAKEKSANTLTNKTLTDLLKASPEASESLYRVLVIKGQVNEQEGGSHRQWQVSNQVDANAWMEQVNTWITKFKEKAEGFDRKASSLPRLKVDNYFGSFIERLYPTSNTCLEEVQRYVQD